MKKISAEVFHKIDNSIYDSDLIDWWKKEASFNLIQTVLNPVRVNYFKRILKEIRFESSLKDALEVGCGGGILTEEIAGMGYKTWGIDPSEKSLLTAKDHAKSRGLSINYQNGVGEQIPFADRSFDLVFCCDVLEHVGDSFKVISEIARVLKKGGLFFYDTMNRTMISNLVVIRIMQKWKYFSFLPSNLHVWEMFIRPKEIKEMLLLTGLQWKEHRGITGGSSNLSLLGMLHKRAAGKLTNEEFSRKCRLTEGRSLQAAYMGYAVKI